VYSETSGSLTSIKVQYLSETPTPTLSELATPKPD